MKYLATVVTARFLQNSFILMRVVTRTVPPVIGRPFRIYFFVKTAAIKIFAGFFAEF
jgi:hypothetical protein